MFPAEGILRAALRWMQLLARSTFSQAAALLRSDPTYADQSPTQYASAMDWLKSSGIVVNSANGPMLTSAMQGLDSSGVSRLLFAAAVEQAKPFWLAESDSLIQDTDDLPEDASSLASALQLTAPDALMIIRKIHGRVDLTERTRVGAVGERLLVEYLEDRWPNSTRQVSLYDDGYGYDVEFNLSGKSWHLEVKSTTRKGRLTVHLSRHEHEVAKLDPSWRLIAVGIDHEDQLAALASASTASILSRAPLDLYPTARWESVRHQLSPADLRAGLPFVNVLFPRVLLNDEGLWRSGSFGWMPND